MDKAIQVFSFEQREVRVIDKDGEPWFVGKDVCDYFGDTNHNRSLGRLDDDEKGVREMNTPGGKQSLTVINEAGLYHLLFNFEPTEARGVSPEYVKERQMVIKKFRRWVTHDVLPTIRKTGSYTIRPDKAKNLELAEGRLNTQRARLLMRMIENPAYPITDDSKLVLIHEVTKLATNSEHPEILPDKLERLYSATDIGKELGVTNRAVHKLARELNIRPEEGTRNEYAVWKMSKSPYSTRECGQLFFTEDGKIQIEEALKDDSIETSFL